MAATTTDTKTSLVVSAKKQASSSASYPNRFGNLTNIPERKVVIKYVTDMKRSRAEDAKYTPIEHIFYPIDTQIEQTGDDEYKYEYHEFLDGRVVPYYDFEFEHTDIDSKFDTGDTTWNDFVTCNDAVKDLWGSQARFIWQSACGWKVEGKHWKSSFHCLVRGCGYVNSVSDIPMTALANPGPDGKHLGQDPQPYNGKNRQLIRAFASTKEDGSRPLKYFAPDMDKCEFREVDFAQYREDWQRMGWPPIAEQFIQYTGSEEFESMTPAIARELDAELGEPDSKEIKREARPLDTKYRKIGRDELREHILNLSPTRVGRGTVGSRHRIVWAIANYAAQLGEDLREEAHMFRKLDAIDWANGGEMSCDKCYDEAIGFRKHMSGIATILACSREDNPEMYRAITAKYRLENVEVIEEFQCFRDYTKFMERPVNIDTIIRWMQACIHPIVKGSKLVYLITHNQYDSDNKKLKHVENVLCKPKDLQAQCSKVLIECKNPNKATAEKHPVVTNLWEIVDWLLKRESIIPAYSRIDFIPWNKEDPTHREIFNTFVPFEMKSYVPTKEMKFEGSKWQQHIYTDICRENKVDPGLYEFLIKSIAHLIQNPGEQQQLFIVLFGPTGIGKSLLSNWISAMLGKAYSMSFTTAENYFANFNVEQERKIFVFLEELGENKELNKHNEQFKAKITSPTIRIEPKGIDPYYIKNVIHLWAATNKSNFMHMSGDERRTVVIPVSDAHAENRDYFGPIDAEIKNPDYIKACFDYFSSIDLTDFDAGKPFMTQFKRQRQSDCKEPVLKFVEAIFADNDEKEYRKTNVDLFDEYKTWAQQVEGITFRSSATAWARNMSDHGFTTRQEGSRGERKSYYTITRDQARNAIRKYLRNPAYKFQSDE